MKLRLVLVDDQVLFREGLRAILSLTEGLEVVGQAGNGNEALAVCRATVPDVVLMDIRMPELDGVGAIRQLRATLPKVQIVVLTTFDDDASVLDGLRAGAVGYLLKDAPRAQLVDAIHAAARGESVLQPHVAAKVVAELYRTPQSAPAAKHGLSPREVDVLRLVARGASNKEIAGALFLSEGTIKNHITSILAKLGVVDRTQAALRARDLGIR